MKRLLLVILASLVLGQRTWAQDNFFDQKLDHFDSASQRTFAQRYFVKMNPNATALTPVLLMVCGEYRCDSPFDNRIAAYAEKLGAHLVALEHRYYGDSLPAKNLTAANLKQLSFAQALEDISTFQDFARSRLGLSGPWIAIGGSYAGQVVAAYRMLHPERVAGALSSSGTVRTEFAYQGYDKYVAQTLGPSCAKSLQKVVFDIESSFSSRNREAVRKAFASQALQDDGDFSSALSAMIGNAVQYGHKDELCTLLAKPNLSLQQFAQFGLEMLKITDMTPMDWAFKLMKSPTFDSGKFVGLRTFFYHQCTEVGTLVIASLNRSESIFPRQLNEQYYKEACRELFGIVAKDQSQFWNQKYFSPLLDAAKTSNILFTNGSDDPWSSMSITPEVLKKSPNSKISAYTLAKRGHTSDVWGRGDDPEVQRAEDLILATFRQYLGLSNR